MKHLWPEGAGTRVCMRAGCGRVKQTGDYDPDDCGARGQFPGSFLDADDFVWTRLEAIRREDGLGIGT